MLPLAFGAVLWLWSEIGYSWQLWRTTSSRVSMLSHGFWWGFGVDRL
jgi:hypothetical protein